MQQVMRDFLDSRHLLSMGVMDEDGVYMANCFYAFDEEELALIIKSNQDTRHIQLASINPSIGVSVALDTKNLSKIKGLQIKAQMAKATLREENIYYQKYPFARWIKGDVFALRILWAKYTNNTALSRTKIQYHR